MYFFFFFFGGGGKLKKTPCTISDINTNTIIPKWYFKVTSETEPEKEVTESRTLLAALWVPCRLRTLRKESLKVKKASCFQLKSCIFFFVFAIAGQSFHQMSFRKRDILHHKSTSTRIRRGNSHLRFIKSEDALFLDGDNGNKAFARLPHQTKLTWDISGQA